METSRMAGRLTARFVAGREIEQEIGVIERLNREGMLATVDYLGEGVKSLEEAGKIRDVYLGILSQVARLGVGATLSIKLTQFGLGISRDVCRENVGPLVAKAKEFGSRVEIDMEQSDHVDATLEIVGQDAWPGMGVCAPSQRHERRAAAGAVRTAAGILGRICKRRCPGTI
jgi:proline dehydrogenase